MTEKRKVRRSGLTMPVVTPRFVDNAWRRGCDFINLDLEDSVPQHLKGYARGLIKDAIANVSKGGAEVFTRINHDLMQADLEAIIWPGLSKVNYPKAEYGAEIQKLDRIITRLERERGIRPGTVEIGANIETSVGVANAYEIASASPRVQEFGGASGYDMSRDLGVEMFVGFDQFVYGKAKWNWRRGLWVWRYMHLRSLPTPPVASAIPTVHSWKRKQPVSAVSEWAVGFIPASSSLRSADLRRPRKRWRMLKRRWKSTGRWLGPQRRGPKLRGGSLTSTKLTRPESYWSGPRCAGSETRKRRRRFPGLTRRLHSHQRSAFSHQSQGRKMMLGI